MERQIKKEEIQYSIKTRKFIKKTFVNKVPNELILEIIKYVGFNEIQLNNYNMLYKYYNYDLTVVNYNSLQHSNYKFNPEWETSLT
tara:strand:+ start:527 stop:784 length:258 start_codon:yes stop_codon:yes gene_type:complete